MTNPYQEPTTEDMSLGEALRTMAERTAFRSEGERDAVLTALDKHTSAQDTDPDATSASADENDRDPDGNDARGEQAGTSESPSPADVPAAARAQQAGKTTTKATTPGRR